MLGKEFLKCRRRAGKLIPVFGDPEDAGLQETAGDLLLLYRDAAERRVSRGELAEPVEALIRGRGEPAGAFAKLLEDQCRFETAQQLDYPAIRKTLFQQSGALWKSGVPPEEWGSFAAEIPEDIYGDLPENEQLLQAPEYTPAELIHRYNVGLVQGFLLYARSMTFTFPAPEAAELRRNLRYLKFFRLLAEVHRNPDRSVEMTVSGPFSLFCNTRKYAVQLAAFFPAVLLTRQWKLTAEIQWQNRDLTLQLDHTSKLRSPYRPTTAYVPEEFAMFQKLFCQKSDLWEISQEGDLRTSESGELLIPDFTFCHRISGERVSLELFHRWHKTPMEMRLQWLAAHPETPWLLGIDRSLADDGEFEAICSRYPQIAERLFLFRDFPGVDRVEKMLNRFPA